MKKHLLTLLIMLILTGCGRAVTLSPTDPIVLPTSTSTAAVPVKPTPLPKGASPVLISEVLAGIQGNNNYEFIELYNRSTEIIDLLGWSLWYRLPSSQEDLFVFRWTSSTLIPPYGHYLLGRAEQNLKVNTDAYFDVPLNTAGGGLQLRQMDGKVRDSLGWGNPQEGYVEGKPAPALQNGTSLERLPGGDEGSAHDLDENASDFISSESPHPQNTGSPLTPVPDHYLAISVNAPESAEPGTSFEYELSIANNCAGDAENIQVVVPINPNLEVTTLPEGMILDDATAVWNIPVLVAGESQTVRFLVDVPWTYFNAQVSSYYAVSDACPLPAFGEPITTRIEGGVIPIGTARTLIGADLTIEGIATAYTGAYYAGTGNVKFYLEDETGAIQVQVFEGQGEVAIPIGARVSVRGNVSVYRGSTQIVPIIVPDDVVILADASNDFLLPTPASIQAASTDLESLPGKLVQVQGIVTRLEEYSYSYELDLADPEDLSQVLTLYIDKQTNIQVEQIETEDHYVAVGILDIRDTRHLLYPRIQEDLRQVFPPSLRLEVTAPALVESGEPITYTLIAFNHTSEAISEIIVQATLPSGTSLLKVDPSGSLDGETITWHLDELSAEGGSQTLEFTVALFDVNQDQVSLSPVRLISTEWPEVVSSSEVNTFTTGQVPIWAIQGSGFRSPYVLTTVTTQGVVTGVFPDLSGFFIQELNSDEDASTSPGLFISAAVTEVIVNPGDLIEITGKVREMSGQTALQITGPESVSLIDEGSALPAVVELDPPESVEDAQVYYEKIEGALVQVTGPAMAVSPTTKYGEVVLVLAKHDVNRLYQGEDNGLAIMVDDGSSMTHVDSSTLPYSVTTGDTVSGVIGPLAYTYNHYKIEPIAIPQVERSGLEPTILEPTADDEFSIMSWNVENLFDALDPHPSDPPKPLPSEYRLQLEKVANTILAAGSPTIVALQEVENIGILEDLATHEYLQGYSYEPVLIEGFDSRGIDVGYLVRGDQASVLDVQQRDAPEGLFSRPPLLLKVEVEIAEKEVVIFLLNNHFVSMSGGEEATEPQRIAQAEWNLQLVHEILALEPDAYIAMVGDLNSFFDSKPIQTLREGGLVHTLDLLPPEMRYTYIFEGESEVLDHILITESFLDLLLRVEILHVNADFPLPSTDDASPWHKSDHDPVVATFMIK